MQYEPTAGGFGVIDVPTACLSIVPVVVVRIEAVVGSG